MFVNPNTQAVPDVDASSWELTEPEQHRNKDIKAFCFAPQAHGPPGRVFVSDHTLVAQGVDKAPHPLFVFFVRLSGHGPRIDRTRSDSSPSVCPLATAVAAATS